MTESPRDVLLELHRLVGAPGYEALAGHSTGLSKSSVGNLVKGRGKPRPSTVVSFVEACLGYAGTRRTTHLSPEQRLPDYWRRRYDAASRPPGNDGGQVVSDYLRAVGERFGRLGLDTLIPLNDQDEHPPMWLREVFVGQDVRADPPPVELPKDMWRRIVESGHLADGDLPAGLDRDVVDRLHRSYQQRPRRSVLRVVAHPSSTRAVLLGDPGAGKSTLARYLALALAGGVPLPAELEPLRGLVPLVIELRVYASTAWGTGDFLDLVAHLHKTEHFGMPRATAEALLNAGRALVVFDGLDEVFDPASRETISRRIIGFAAKYPKIRVIVTSRIVGYQRTALDTAGFAHHKLEDLDREQVEAFVARWYATTFPDDAVEAARMGRRLLSAVDTSRAVAELAGNPLLLTILAIIGRRRELPRDRRAVYQHAVTVLVQHWDISKHLAEVRVDDGLSTIVEEDKLELLRRVARRMQDAPSGLAGNHIPGTDLTEEFERYLRDRLELPAHRARPVAEAMLEQFRHRNFILSRFGAGVYGFVHRAFLEYLAADDIYRRFTHERSLDENDLVRVYARHWDDPAWHEVLRHITGMLNENFARLAIEHLLTLNPNWRHSPTDLPHHIVLAVQCLGEIGRLGPLAPLSRAVADAVAELFVVASIRQRNLDVRLTELLEQSVLPALSVFSPYWAGREMFQAWYARDHRVLVQQAGEREPVVLNLATRVMAHLAGDDAGFRQTLREQTRTSGAPAARVAAIAGLAAGDMDENDTALLLELVDDESDDAVRAAAVTALGPRLAAGRLRDLTPRRSDSELLHAVVAVVAENWPDDEETLPWLRRLFADHQFARSPVLDALSTGWSGDPEVLAWLRDQVEERHPVRTRELVVEAIGKGWGQQPGVREWLTELAERGGTVMRRAALSAVATRWRHDPEVVRWLRCRAEQDRDSSIRETAVKRLCEIWTGDEAETQLREWARHDPIAQIRVTAIETVAARTSGPELRAWLRDIATGDPSWYPRSTAIECLAAAGEDGDWLERQVFTDPDTSVRVAALRAIAAHSAKPDLLAWLRQVAVTEPSAYVRQSAVSLVAEGWPRSPSILTWLRERVASADGGAALAEIVNGWPDEPGMLDWLRGLAAAQTAEEVRRQVVELVATGWGSDAATVDWLRPLAETDVNEDIRRRATEAVARHERDKPGLLTWLHERLVTDWSPDVQLTVVEIVAEYWEHSPAARQWVLDRWQAWPDANHWRLQYLLRARWLADPGLRQHLRDLTTHERNGDLRRTALQEAVGGWEDLPDTVAWLRERVVDDPDPEVRLEALHALDRAPQDEELVAWMREITSTDPSPKVRARALELTTDSPEEVRAMLAATADPEAREKLLDTLVSRWGQRDDVRDWVRNLAASADDDRTRAYAMWTFANNWETHPGLLDWLWERAADPSEVVRWDTLTVIARSWTHLPGVVDRLKAVADPEWTVRLAVVMTSKEWPPGAETAEWLRTRAREDDNPAVRAMAIQAMASVEASNPDLISWLRERFTTEDDWHPRSAVVEVVAHVGARLPGTVEWLRAVATSDADPLVRGIALEWWALGWAHDPAVRAELTALGAEDPRQCVRLAAVRALGGARPGDSAVTEWLRERTRDQDEYVAAAAARELTTRLTVPKLLVEDEDSVFRRQPAQQGAPTPGRP